MIRNWVGMTNSDDFYNACDKYGVLVWDDFWLANHLDGPDPADPAMFIKNAKDKVLKIRHHASIPLYCGRNECMPPETLSDVLPQIVKELDGTRHYIPESARGTVSGYGPYWVCDPKWYFANAPETLHSERGLPNVPEIESMRKMLGPDHLWPIDDVWGMHDWPSMVWQTYDKKGMASNMRTTIKSTCGKLVALTIAASAIFPMATSAENASILKARDVGMTGYDIAMAGLLSFGQVIPSAQKEIVKHSGLQLIHADGAVTLRLKVPVSGRTLMENGIAVRLSGKFDSASFEVTSRH